MQSPYAAWSARCVPGGYARTLPSSDDPCLVSPVHFYVRSDADGRLHTTRLPPEAVGSLSSPVTLWVTIDDVSVHSIPGAHLLLPADSVLHVGRHREENRAILGSTHTAFMEPVGSGAIGGVQHSAAHTSQTATKLFSQPVVATDTSSDGVVTPVVDAALNAIANPKHVLNRFIATRGNAFEDVDSTLRPILETYVSPVAQAAAIQRRDGSSSSSLPPGTIIVVFGNATPVVSGRVVPITFGRYVATRFPDSPLTWPDSATWGTQNVPVAILPLPKSKSPRSQRRQSRLPTSVGSTQTHNLKGAADAFVEHAGVDWRKRAAPSRIDVNAPLSGWLRGGGEWTPVKRMTADLLATGYVTPAEPHPSIQAAGHDIASAVVGVVWNESSGRGHRANLWPMAIPSVAAAIGRHLSTLVTLVADFEAVLLGTEPLPLMDAPASGTPITAPDVVIGRLLSMASSPLMPLECLRMLPHPVIDKGQLVGYQLDWRSPIIDLPYPLVSAVDGLVSAPGSANLPAFNLGATILRATTTPPATKHRTPTSVTGDLDAAAAAAGTTLPIGFMMSPSGYVYGATTKMLPFGAPGTMKACISSAWQDGAGTVAVNKDAMKAEMMRAVGRAFGGTLPARPMPPPPPSSRPTNSRPAAKTTTSRPVLPKKLKKKTGPTPFDADTFGFAFTNFEPSSSKLRKKKKTTTTTATTTSPEAVAAVVTQSDANSAHALALLAARQKVSQALLNATGAGAGAGAGVEGSDEEEDAVVGGGGGGDEEGEEPLTTKSVEMRNLFVAFHAMDSQGYCLDQHGSEGGLLSMVNSRRARRLGPLGKIPPNVTAAVTRLHEFLPHPGALPSPAILRAHCGPIEREPGVGLAVASASFVAAWIFRRCPILDRRILRPLWLNVPALRETADVPVSAVVMQHTIGSWLSVWSDVVQHVPQVTAETASVLSASRGAHDVATHLGSTIEAMYRLLGIVGSTSMSPAAVHQLVPPTAAAKTGSKTRRPRRVPRAETWNTASTPSPVNDVQLTGAVISEGPTATAAHILLGIGHEEVVAAAVGAVLALAALAAVQVHLDAHSAVRALWVRMASTILPGITTDILRSLLLSGTQSPADIRALFMSFPATADSSSSLVSRMARLYTILVRTVTIPMSSVNIADETFTSTAVFSAAFAPLQFLPCRWERAADGFGYTVDSPVVWLTRSQHTVEHNATSRDRSEARVLRQKPVVHPTDKVVTLATPMSAALLLTQTGIKKDSSVGPDTPFPDAFDTEYEPMDIQAELVATRVVGLSTGFGDGIDLTDLVMPVRVAHASARTMETDVDAWGNAFDATVVGLVREGLPLDVTATGFVGASCMLLEEEDEDEDEAPVAKTTKKRTRKKKTEAGVDRLRRNLNAFKSRRRR